MNRQLIFVLTFSAVLAFSCRKPVVLPQEETKITKKQRINIPIKNLDFLYFHTRAKLEYKDPDNQFSSGVNIRMRKDSVIWISVTPGLGIEAIRCLVTKDSVFIINRLGKGSYNKYAMSFFSEQFHFDFNLAYLQNMILGNLCNPINDDDELSQKNDYQIVHQKRNSYMIDNFVNPTSLKIEKLQITDTLNQSTLSMSYSEFKPIDTMQLAYKNLILLNFNNEKGLYSMAIDINHNKADINDKQLKFPFNVPNRFEKK